MLDGSVSFAFPDGVVAKLEIRPEDALRTVVFSTYIICKLKNANVDILYV